MEVYFLEQLIFDVDMFVAVHYARSATTKPAFRHAKVATQASPSKPCWYKPREAFHSCRYTQEQRRRLRRKLKFYLELAQNVHA